MIDPLLLRLLVVLAVVGTVAAVGRWWTGRAGRVRGAIVARDGGEERLAAHHLSATGLDLGDAVAGAILVGSPTCGPCVTVERLLGELAADRDGFRWVKVDATDHLELTTAHRIRRVPTLLLVDRERRVVARTVGVPAPADLTVALDAAAARTGV